MNKWKNTSYERKKFEEMGGNYHPVHKEYLNSLKGKSISNTPHYQVISFAVDKARHEDVDNITELRNIDKDGCIKEGMVDEYIRYNPYKSRNVLGNPTADLIKLTMDSELDARKGKALWNSAKKHGDGYYSPWLSMLVYVMSKYNAVPYEDIANGNSSRNLAIRSKKYLDIQTINSQLSDDEREKLANEGMESVRPEEEDEEKRDRDRAV